MHHDIFWFFGRNLFLEDFLHPPIHGWESASDWLSHQLSFSIFITFLSKSFTFILTDKNLYIKTISFYTNKQMFCLTSFIIATLLIITSLLTSKHFLLRENYNFLNKVYPSTIKTLICTIIPNLELNNKEQQGLMILAGWDALPLSIIQPDLGWHTSKQ